MLRMPNVDLTPLADAIKYAADMAVWAAAIVAIALILRRSR